MAKHAKPKTPPKSSFEFTNSTAQLPQDIYTSLKTECDSLGISISKLCREADVDRSLLERWRKNEPQSIKTYRLLVDALERMRTEITKSK